MLLHLDNVGGGSPLEAGGELAVVTLQAASAAEGAPMTCSKVDAAAVDADGNTLRLESSMDVGSVAVTGKTVALTTPAPVVVEEGVEQDAQSLLETQKNPAASPALTAQPVAGAASQPAQTDETQNPAPTPFYTTSPSGEKVEILPSESAEPVDRTEEVLSGQPATAPSDSGATATVPWQPLAAGVVVVAVVVLAGVFVYRRTSHRKTGRK